MVARADDRIEVTILAAVVVSNLLPCFRAVAASGSTATRPTWHTWHPRTHTTLCPKNWSFERPVEPTLALAPFVETDSILLLLLYVLQPFFPPFFLTLGKTLLPGLPLPSGH